MAQIDVTLKFIIRSGSTTRIVEEEATVVADARIANLVDAIREAFADGLGLSANQGLSLYIEPPAMSTLTDMGVKDGDTIVLIADARQGLVQPKRAKHYEK